MAKGASATQGSEGKRRQQVTEAGRRTRGRQEVELAGSLSGGIRSAEIEAI